MVHFLRAPRRQNRNRLYEVVNTTLNAYEGETGGTVCFRLRGEEYVYIKGLRELQEIGMTLYRSVDENDPAKGEE